MEGLLLNANLNDVLQRKGWVFPELEFLHDLSRAHSKIIELGTFLVILVGFS